MFDKNPASMMPEEITQEIDDLRKNIERASTRIHELSKNLLDRYRKLPEDKAASIYITYSNSWIRLAGVFTQALARTKHASRILGMLPEKEVPQEPKKVKTQPKKEERTIVDDLMDMYNPNTESSETAMSTD